MFLHIYFIHCLVFWSSSFQDRVYFIIATLRLALAYSSKLQLIKSDICHFSRQNPQVSARNEKPAFVYFYVTEEPLFKND